MRVMLVRPPVPPHTIGLKHIMVCEPLELEYVAAGLNDCEIEIVDLILERDFPARLQKFQPDIVGSSCYITGVNEVIKIFRQAKAWNPNVLTVAGGVQASKCYDDFEDDSVDCVALGDGTTIMPEIVAAHRNGSPLNEIAGLALPADGKLVATAPRAYMPHPDTLPFPRRDLVSHLAHKYYYLWHRPVATLKTTWGCWYECNFCMTWQITDGHPYARSAKSIADELSEIEAEHVYIVDDIFLIHPTRLTELARLLRERGIRKKYLAYARADFLAEQEDIIAEWAELGLQSVFIGLEATTDSELESMDKRASVEQNQRAIANLQKHGVEIYGSLIVQPDYDEEDWRRIKKFIDDNDLFFLNVSPLTPMPGTLIWEQYRDQLIVQRKAHGLWDLAHTVLPTKQPLKQYYRNLLGVYAHACFNPLRAQKLNLPTVPPLYSWDFWRLWFGTLKIGYQFLFAHNHHSPGELARASDRGSPIARRQPSQPVPEASETSG